MAERWVSFDCYGTSSTGRPGCARRSLGSRPGHINALLRAYHEHEPRVQAERPFRRYREVLAEALARAAASCDVQLDALGPAVLAATLTSWPVFPDVGAALWALRGDGEAAGDRPRRHRVVARAVGE